MDAGETRGPSAARSTEVFAVFGVEPEIQAYAMAKYSRSALSMKESLRRFSFSRAAVRRAGGSSIASSRRVPEGARAMRNKPVASSASASAPTHIVAYVIGMYAEAGSQRQALAVGRAAHAVGQHLLTEGCVAILLCPTLSEGEEELLIAGQTIQ